MANDIEVTLKVKDELTKGMKKAAESLEMTEEAAGKLIDQFEQLGVGTDQMSEEFLKMNPEVAKAVELLKSAKEAGKGFGDTIAGVSDDTKKASESGGDFTKKLKDMAKGLVGVSGAYMVGRAAMAFVKDSLAAADAAGTLPPIFDESAKASERLKEAAGTQLGKALEAPISVMTRMKNSTAENLETVTRLQKAESKGLITTQEASFYRTELNKGMRSHVDVVGVLTEIEGRESDELERQNQLMQDNISHREALAGVTVAQRGALEGLRRAAFDEAQAVVEPDVRAGREVVGGRAFETDVGLGGELAGRLQQAELFKLGWLDVQDEYDKVLLQYSEGTRTLEFAEQTMVRSSVQIKQMELEAGIFNTKWQAAVALGHELDITAQEALTMLESVGKELETLTGKDWNIVVDVSFPGGFGIQGGFGKTGNVQPNALGGGVTAGRTVLVGERGPELFNPGQSGTITPNDQLSGGTGNLEASIDRFGSVLANGLLDIGQMFSEAAG